MHPFFPLYNLIAIDIGIDTAAKLTGTLNYRTPPALNNINSHVEIFSRSYILAYNIYVNMLYDKYTSRTCDKTNFLAKKWNQLYYCCGELLHCETNAICGETFLWELLMPLWNLFVSSIKWWEGYTYQFVLDPLIFVMESFS